MTTAVRTLTDIIQGHTEGLALAELLPLLPPAAQPLGSYVPVVQSGNLVFTSGALPLHNGTLWCEGPIGSYTVDVNEGQQAARVCLINLLATLQQHLGDLSRLQQVVKLVGFVSSVATFTDQPQVINGASDLLVQLFGEAGRHARSAVGVASLPKNASVEIELLVQVTA